MAVPVGPAFVADDSGYGRRLWQPSPDTEEVRLFLLDRLIAVPETPPPTYPAGMSFDDAVVWQLGEFREARALRGLERVWCFDPALTGDGPSWRDQGRTIARAAEALAKVLPPEAIDPAWRTWDSGAVVGVARRIAAGGPSPTCRCWATPSKRPAAPTRRC